MFRIIVVASFFLFPYPALSSEWPTYRGSLSRAGWTAEALATPLHLQWTHTAPSQPQQAWPGPGGKTIEELHLRHRVRFDDVFDVIIVDGNVYYGSSVENCVESVDLRTGQRRWRFYADGPVRLAPMHANGRLYFGSDDGHAYCLDIETGSLIWKRRAGPRDERILARGRMSSRWPVRTGVLVDGGIAYFGAGTFPHETVYICAVQAENGEVIWCNDAVSQQDAGRNDLSPQGHLLATDDLLFVSSGRTLPAAFDRKTGEFVHKQLDGGKQIGGSSALLIDNLLYTIGEHEIVVLDQKTGEHKYRLPGRQIVIAGDTAYVTNQGELHAVDHKKYAACYSNLEMRNEFEEQKARLLAHPYVQTLRQIKEIRANLENAGAGDQRMKQELALLREELRRHSADYTAQRLETESMIGVKWRARCALDSALILCGNRLVVGGVGEIQAFDADNGKRVWQTEVDGEARGLAAADGQLVVSTTSGSVYCYAANPVKDAAAKPQANNDAVAKYVGDEGYAQAASEIINQTGITQGYCLVVGSERGQLAYELAKQTDLKIYCVEKDPEKAAWSREALAEAGLYGWRVTVERTEPDDNAFPNYFANLIVSDTQLLTGVVPAAPERVARRLKPCGGKIFLGSPLMQINNQSAEWLRDIAELIENTEIALEGQMLTRGKLPGAGEWTHQYGNPGSTSMAGGTRLRGGLSVLWYGDPGPSKMLNRHVGAVGPVSANGRLIQQGDETLMAYDAYNGQFLWEIDNAGAMRTGVFNNYESGNLAATDDYVFHVVNDECWQIDAATGDILVRHKIPVASTGRGWGFLAYSNGKLFGTATSRYLMPEEEQHRGRTSHGVHSDTLFAIDINTREPLWTYRGHNILHTTLALSDDRVFFIDASLSQQQRQQFLNQERSKLEGLTGAARQSAEEELKQKDLRLAVAVDAETGEQLWSEPVDVTDCSEIGIGGGQLTLIYDKGHLVLGGANANGHYWDQFLEGEFKRRRLVVLNAMDGSKKWAKDANYRHRPIVVGNQIIAEPWAYDLSTGIQLMRTHPVTGVETPWKFIRPGHHCGMLTATESMLFFRSKYTAYYDLRDDSGTRHFAGHRLGCWINAIPANGLLLIPEASAGCACLFSLTATVAFEPRERENVWGVFTAEGAATPVEHLALNLGGPGDRRDDEGRLWLGYPRPSSRPGLDIPLDLQEEFQEGGRFYAMNSDSQQRGAIEPRWVCSSGARGLRRCSIPLLSAEDPDSTYDVTLMFEPKPSGESEFRITIQGEPNEVSMESDHTASFAGIHVHDALTLELAENVPPICGIRLQRTGD